MHYLIPFFLISIGSAFEHEQALHAKNFRGENQTFCTSLWISVYASWATRIAILVYIAISLSWIAAIVMFFGEMFFAGAIAGLLSGISNQVAGRMGQIYVSFAAFFVWPACYLSAYLLLPKVV